MGASFSRMTELINDTDEKLEIRECVDGDLMDNCAVRILLRGREHKKIRATKFTDRRIGSTRSRDIKIMRNGVCHKILGPDDFRMNLQLIFRIENKGLVVEKVESEGISDDFRRLKVLACFWRPDLREIRRAGHPPVPQKWMDECQNATPDSINLEDENEEGSELAPLKMPIGRKAAKEVMKKAKSKEHVGDNENIPSTSSSEFEDFRAKKLESESLSAQQFELLIASEQKQVALREKEIELQQRSEDAKIMAMDTSAMSPIRAEYFISLQKEILAKRAGSGFNQ